ncbi:SURF1 family protein [Bradyrhizobium sp. U87765 SZCCT0109]|uniref:SURF1 family protein n=2 Tax=Bradyrhizobium TaxID=374 RepID=UPI00352BF628
MRDATRVAPANDNAHASATAGAFGVAPARAARRPLTRAIVGLLALAGIAMFIALGVWQVERRAWKLNLIATVERRIHAAPMAAPGLTAWPALTQDNAAYRRIKASGHYLNDRETLVQAVTDLGPGFWVMTPFVTDAGFTVLVNRGFVPTERRAAASRRGGDIIGATTVSGLLRLTEPKGAFLRTNDPAADRWYSRDVAAIAAARGLGAVPPYFIDADASDGPASAPRGGLTVISFPNNHLVYALTWFALAAGLSGATAFVARDEWRRMARRRPDRRRGTPT